MNVLNALAIRLLNHLILAENWAQARLIGHSGAQVVIESGLLVVRLAIDEHGLFQSGDSAHEPDVRITLPADVPVRLLLSRDSLFSSVKLDGSADIAESLAFVLRNLQWDAEADLAELVGDIPAHRFARLARTMAVAIPQAIASVANNFSEYAAEESGMLTPNRDVADFGKAVNSLRDDVARLEKRISRL